MLLAVWQTADERAELRVGSKAFTESVILAEIVAHVARSTGARATTRELGGTAILWGALLEGEISVYPEYTGTIAREILSAEKLGSETEIRAALESRGIRMSRPLGFNNTYELGMKEEVAERLGIRKISDLEAHPGLRFGFSNEFMDRDDGWPSLRAAYRLPQQDVRGLAHDLAYRGLTSGALDLMDLYSTDAEIRYYGLRVLDDDLGHFPRYEAVLLFRDDLVEREPRLVSALLRLEGKIDAAAMIAMNARAKLRRVPANHVAADFVDQVLGLETTLSDEGIARRLLLRTIEHLTLVGTSMILAITIALPLGILAARKEALGQLVLAASGIMQTIPSLALFVFLIPLLGIGAPPTIAALFLYSLLPIVRNTYAGLEDIPLSLKESAAALGLHARARLWHIELPMAARSILAGIKTSVVINVGTATIGAFISAGGYGQPILTGLRLDDWGLILQGAIPAALLALLLQGLFEIIERLCVPQGLRLKADGTS
ncbi:MAG: glycine betaine ABC transporter substrate-binding protein [Planctomycetota bacterium]